MESKIYSVDELKQLFVQELINKADGRVSKVSDHSVLNGVAYGFARVFQKSMKDVALLESELFPESAYGEYLDKIAQRYGISPRKKNLGSSVWVKLVATSGTLYDKDACSFMSSNGISFLLEENFTIGDNGWGYAKLKSDGTGTNTNVETFTITKVVDGPSGHIFVTNELPATGGVDSESDEDFCQRILQNFNNFSFETLDKLTAVMQKENQNVFGCRKVGRSSSNGYPILGIISCNGVDFSSSELSDLEDACVPYLSLQDLYSANELNQTTSPIVLQNIGKTYLDLDFRVSLYSDVDIDDFRVTLQGQIMQYLNFKDHKVEKIEWEDIFAIVRNLSGVRGVSETTFFCGNSANWPTIVHEDITVSQDTIPRMRECVIRDENGTILSDNNGSLVPYYYGNEYTNIFDEINSTI